MMLRRHQEMYFQLFQVVDALLLCFALWVSHLIRYSLIPELRFLDLGTVAPFAAYVWMLILILPLGPFILERQGFYRSGLATTTFRSVLAALRGVVILVLALAVFMVVLRVPQETVSRAALTLFIPISVLLLSAREFLARNLIFNRRRSELNRQHILLCGSPADIASWQDALVKQPGGAFEVGDTIDLNAAPLPEFIRRLHEKTIDVVIFSIEHTNFQVIREALRICESEGIEAWIGADFFQTSLARPQFDQFGGRPLLVFRSAPDASWEMLIKRTMDCVIAFVLLTVFSWLLIAVALAIWISSGRPVIFKQRRSGRYGRPFTMYKFRTMVTDAEKARKELEKMNMMSGPVFKVEDDPRVTRIGKFLRRTSLDELPQLFNVLMGEMSMVGPRPLPLYETQNFSEIAQRRRMSVRPGITCLWQIRGRNTITDFSDWVRLDLEYIDNWSLWLDLKILLITIPAVLFGRGAK